MREARCFADYEAVVILFVILYKSYIVRLEMFALGNANMEP